MRRFVYVALILLWAGLLVWYIKSCSVIIERKVPQDGQKIVLKPPLEKAPAPREVKLPDWQKLHKLAKSGKHVSGALTLGFPEGGFADVYLVDGDKEVRFQTIGSYLAEPEAHYGVDFGLGLREFDTVTPNMKIVVRGSNIAGRKPEKPKINFTAFEIDDGNWFRVR